MHGRTQRSPFGKFLPLAAVAPLALLLSACLGPSQPDQFYMLRAVDESSVASYPGQGPLVGLGPVRIPAYLDRPQMVVAASGQEYRLSEDHRWAERLDDNIARVSAQNLAGMIPSDRILLHPWPREPRPDAQLAVNVQEMHVDPAGQARLTVLWTLRHGDDATLSRRFACRQPASLTDYPQMVEAFSQCLARLNREMAGAVRGLGPAR